MQQLRQEAGDPVMAGKRLPYPCRVNLPKTGGAVLTKVAAYRSKLLLFIYFSLPIKNVVFNARQILSAFLKLGSLLPVL